MWPRKLHMFYCIRFSEWVRETTDYHEFVPWESGHHGVWSSHWHICDNVPRISCSIAHIDCIAWWFVWIFSTDCKQFSSSSSTGSPVYWNLCNFPPHWRFQNWHWQAFMSCHWLSRLKKVGHRTGKHFLWTSILSFSTEHVQIVSTDCSRCNHEGMR